LLKGGTSQIEVPTFFMDLMSKVFMEYLDKFTIEFINGILVTPRAKKNVKNISVWYHRSFKTLDCTSR
jgi:hypothetical protein